MTLDDLEFLGEEVILRAEKIEKKQENAFLNSGMIQEKKQLSRFKVVKVGQLQTKLKEGDYILISKNGLEEHPITIEGVGVIKDTYALPTHQRIFCKIK